MNRLIRVATEIIRVTFSRETLAAVPPPEALAPGASPPVVTGFFRAVFGHEELPLDPVKEHSPRLPVRSLLSWIFSFEALPLDPEPVAPPKRGWFSTMFGREALGPPSDP